LKKGKWQFPEHVLYIVTNLCLWSPNISRIINNMGCGAPPITVHPSSPSGHCNCNLKVRFVSINKQSTMVRVHELSVNDHLDGLKQKFDLMAEEIDSLRKERDIYKARGK